MPEPAHSASSTALSAATITSTTVWVSPGVTRRTFAATGSVGVESDGSSPERTSRTASPDANGSTGISPGLIGTPTTDSPGPGTTVSDTCEAANNVPAVRSADARRPTSEASWSAVLGATGFIGRYLVQSLLQRGKGTVYVLVRPKSIGKLDELREFWGKESVRRVVAIKGDLAQPKLGVSKADLTRLKGKVKHFFHLGAVYDLEASAEAMHKANIVGTQAALEFAEAVNAGCFHLVSSIAAAGLYRGTFPGGE